MFCVLVLGVCVLVLVSVGVNSLCRCLSRCLWSVFVCV